MKQLRKLSILLFSVTLLAGCVEGCKSGSVNQIAYQSTGTTIVSVDQAMKLWGAYVAAKHPPVEQEIQVKTAFQKYQAAMLIVCDAGATYSSATSTNITSSAGVLEVATTGVLSSITDLENLITKFGVTLK